MSRIKGKMPMYARYNDVGLQVFAVFRVETRLPRLSTARLTHLVVLFGLAEKLSVGIGMEKGRAEGGMVKNSNENPERRIRTILVNLMPYPRSSRLRILSDPFESSVFEEAVEILELGQSLLWFETCGFVP